MSGPIRDGPTRRHWPGWSWSTIRSSFASAAATSTGIRRSSSASCDGKAADLIVVPRTVDEVVQVAAACAQPPRAARRARRRDRQLRPDGAAQGRRAARHGATRRALWIERGRGRFEAGVRLEAADTAGQQSGWELRMFPRRGGRPRSAAMSAAARRASARCATASCAMPALSSP